MSGLPTIAVAGATSNLGRPMIETVLSDQFRLNFKRVVILVREASKETDAWKEKDGDVIIYSIETVTKALEDVDILVNAIGASGHEMKDKIAEVLPSSSIKLYFPSEFGVDHRVHDFSHFEWDYKKQHYEQIRQSCPGLHICRVFNGLFLERGLAPWYGFEAVPNTYEIVGSLDATMSFTALHDVARTVFTIAQMSFASVPDIVKISGDRKSPREIARITEQCRNEPITLKQIPLAQFREEIASKEFHPVNLLRINIGEGNLDNSKDGQGHNDLVNPGETLWKWETVEKYVAKTKGKNC